MSVTFATGKAACRGVGVKANDNGYTCGYYHGCIAGCITTALVAVLWARHGALLALALLAGALPLIAALGVWVLRPSSRRERPSPPPAPAAAGAANEWPSGYEDPLRWTFLPSTGVQYANRPFAYEREDELCSLKALVLHQPTHDPSRSNTGDFPYAWHLAGRRRLWEVRLQVRFKRLPRGPLYVGIENGGPAPASGFERRMNELLVGTVRRTVGDMYASPGDDPACGREELEPATMAVPLGAFDQFVVSEPGSEPDITQDLTDLGMRRTDGLSAYLRAMRAATESLSTDKVYTFCFWGVSQFLDCMNWRVRMGVQVDFNRFCGRPPWFFAMYELAQPRGGAAPDRRHLLSRKRYYVHVAIWSELQPPDPDALARLLGKEAPGTQREERRALATEHGIAGMLSRLARCCCGGCRAGGAKRCE